MASLRQRLFRRTRDETPEEDTREVLIEDDGISTKPFILSSIFYIVVILFIGVPMWFYTCSTTRYSLPDLSEIEYRLTKSANSPPKLHLDVSIIQLARYASPSSSNSNDFNDDSNDKQADYLRANLKNILSTSIENVTYQINWRVRRPTQDEKTIFQNHQRENTFYPDALANLETKLIQVHKPTNRFRLFMYLIDDKYYSTYCDPARPHTYTLSFERFAYLCPSKALTTSENSESTIVMINDILNEVYSNSVDLQRAKHILSTQMDLLFSLVPESISLNSLESLAELAEKVHKIYHKNINERFPELKELVNTRLITQNVVDLLDSRLLARIVKRPVKDPNPNITNEGLRTIQVDRLDQLFHSFESRLNRHSSQNVHNVLLIVSDPLESPIVFKEKSLGLNILERKDTDSLLLATDDKSLVLELRAVVRRLIGLSSANLCKNCHVRRDVFLNRWEIDAVMGILTMIKLQKTLISLESIGEQSIGIKIPKEVARMARESHDLVLKAIEHLDTKRTLESYRLASKAYEISESAYYDPSLLESLYFPEDLKYAIYLPLFLPLALPITMSIIRLSKLLYKSFRNGSSER